ncbi:uncharacterized protein LOC129596889 [Paramacrobiotus metropolitanus]|uniref:uncharacterized protein LOC129596889 n=1 Tax=Paramacrobiotus metropolitanus TaxID=2943436 RepID=UPI0024461C12|nr:uncharacterized protein LOC129596889 [Paramacrobiotus metropolitanus]
MKLIILVGLLVVVATSLADEEQSLHSECCRAPKYTVALSSLLALSEGAAKPSNGVANKAPTGEAHNPKPWNYAVRVGKILHLTSLRSFESLKHHDKIIHPGNPYLESLQIMNLTNQILKEAGCTSGWNNVHDVVVLVTGSTDNFKNVRMAMGEFCGRTENNCLDYPWIAHFRTALALRSSATVEFAVQASNCNFTGEVVGRDHHPQPECCSEPEHTISLNWPRSLDTAAKLERLNYSKPFATRVGKILYLMSVQVPDDFLGDTTRTETITYQEVQWVMECIKDILHEAGCTWNDVHDVAVLVTDGLTHYTDIDHAVRAFCQRPDINCPGFPWAAHLRSAPSLAGNATVEFTVQASNCKWSYAIWAWE